MVVVVVMANGINRRWKAECQAREDPLSNDEGEE